MIYDSGYYVRNISYNNVITNYHHAKLFTPPPQRKIDDIFFPVTNNTITTNLKHTSICLSPQLGDSGLHLSILS